LANLENARYTSLWWAKVQQGVVAHAVVLPFLLRYGEPQIGEQLSDAFRRFAASKAWKACCEEFPRFSRYAARFRRREDTEYRFEPYDRGTLTVIGTPLRHIFISSFPGKDEKEKLNLVFRTAPPWLIWFTFADYTATFLGRDLPDLSSVVGFERSKQLFHNWWGYPRTAFERRPWPHDPAREPLARTDLRLLHLKEGQAGRMTNRDHKRGLATSSAFEFGEKMRWPRLLWAKDGQRNSETKRPHPWLIDEYLHPEFLELDPNPRRRLPPP
jgi:hypothetical protein